MATVLLTGAAGFIGSHTVEALLQRQHRVVGVDNFRTGRRGNLGAVLGHRDFELEEADVSQPGVLDRLTAAWRPDAIIHLAGLVSVTESFADPETNHRLNFTTTELLVETVRAHGVGRLVYASSAAVYGNNESAMVAEDDPLQPANPYGSAKLASERLLLSALSPETVSAVCLRYFNVYGPRQDPTSPYSGVISIFAKALAHSLPITLFGDGLQSRDFVFVGDIAELNARVATAPTPAFGAFNACTGEATSLRELLQLLAPFAARPLEVTTAPARPGDVRRSCGNPGRARQFLGFSAATALAAGLPALLTETAAQSAATRG